MKTNIKIIIPAMLAMALAGCSDWLDPKPLSFYTPENAFNTYEGLLTATYMLDRDIRNSEFYLTDEGVDPVFATELFFSDVAVCGKTDNTVSPQDLNRQINPSATLRGNNNRAKCHTYWRNYYKGIKDANTIIDRAQDVDFEDEDKKMEVLAPAYFHRALRYYRLVHQFGDVPLILHEPSSVRYDYYSTKREVTLRKMKEDLDTYVKYLPVKVDYGRPTQGAGYHLLTKINLALCEFQDAIISANAVIDGGEHSLMTNRFGVDAADPDKNVVWDLHQPENKALPVNREVLYMVQDRGGTTSATSWGMEIKRAVLPWYTFGGSIVSPDGYNGFIDNNATLNPYLAQYGRGIGTIRTTWYHQGTIWAVESDADRANGYGDLRHDRTSGNWVAMEDLKYNNPNMQGVSPYYGQNLQKPGSGPDAAIVADTIRNWFGWPMYKVNVPDLKTSWWRGTHSDWYIFRLAETYLLRAEAYIWAGQPGEAVKDINKVRERANARPLDASEVSIRAVLDERARELYYEEPRKTELTRISYIYATTGKTADNGKTYSLSNFSDSNFFFDHISEVNDFYNKGIFTRMEVEYTMSPFHVLWPIEESTILANVHGKINQNLGYNGSESNIEPIDRAND